MSKRTSSSTASLAVAFTATMLIDGKATEVGVPGGLKPAHGLGLDGKTKVESLKTGKSPLGTDKFLLADMQNVAIEGTAHEFFVAVQQIAAANGYDLIATKRR